MSQFTSKHSLRSVSILYHLVTFVLKWWDGWAPQTICWELFVLDLGVVHGRVCDQVWPLYLVNRWLSLKEFQCFNTVRTREVTYSGYEWLRRCFPESSCMQYSQPWFEASLGVALPAPLAAALPAPLAPHLTRGDVTGFLPGCLLGSKKFKTPASSERLCRQQGRGVAFTLSGSKTDSCQPKIAQLLS